MKQYEDAVDAVTLHPQRPYIVRLDGRAFGTFTSYFKKPFDERITHAMMETAIHLLREFSANAAYVVSDEISLFFFPDREKEDEQPIEPLFGGRPQKIASVMAGKASVRFYQYLFSPVLEGHWAGFDQLRQDVQELGPCFDGRVFNVPDANAAIRILALRLFDGFRNAVGMVAFEELPALGMSKDEINKLNTPQKILKLGDIGVFLDKYPKFNIYGGLVKKCLCSETFTEEEIAERVEKYFAYKPPEARAADEAKLRGQLSQPMKRKKIATLSGELIFQLQPQDLAARVLKEEEAPKLFAFLK